MKVLIVDDEELARERIARLLAREADIDVVGACSDGVQAVEAIERMQPDLVFLDIQMPLMDGFGVLEAVGADRMPATMFVTAYDQHALRAFETHALDYLLKPFEPERFQVALERARRWVRGGERASRPDYGPWLDEWRTRQPWLDRILVRQGDRHILVRTRQVQWMEAEGNYIRLHLEDTSHLLRQTLSGLLLRLDPSHFRRIHRSVAVNIDFISEIRHSVQGDWQVVMVDGMRLNLSRSFRDLFGEWAVAKEGF